MALREPQSAADYTDRATTAAKSVLVEIGQLLGSFRGKFAIIGGAVPWLLLDQADMPHIGTVDVDLVLDPSALADDEYVGLVEALLAHGYRQRHDLRRFQLVRTVPARDNGPDTDVVVDFLMPRHAKITKNTPPLIRDFAVQRADGGELAIEFHRVIPVEGCMPAGGANSVRLAVASIPALLAMKGHALANRKKPKDAYDIYYSIRNFPDGINALVEATRPLLDVDAAQNGYNLISRKFRHVGDFGPTCVRRFVEGSHLLADRTAAQWQRDAFGQVDVWLARLGLR